jgi:carbonic anhydrase
MISAKWLAVAVGMTLVATAPAYGPGVEPGAGLLALAGDEPEHGGPTANGSKALATEKDKDAGKSTHASKSTEKTKAEGKSESKSETSGETQDPDAVIKLLAEGNDRWVSDKTQNPNDEPTRRALLAEQGQKPIATIITCSDSRLPVERIFDRGVGELFVVRVAGNVAGESETGTVEYGVEHLKTPVLIIMGHTKCGAVAAAASDTQLHGALGKLVAHVNPAVERARKGNPGIDTKELALVAIRENVWQTIFDLLKESDEVRNAVKSGNLKVVGAVCDISTGKVNWMGEHPWQTEIVTALDTRSSGGPQQAQASEGH